MVTLYDVIGVNPKASMEDIEAACLRLGEVRRPDKNLNSPSIAASFKLIETAYETLTDPEKRAQYDIGLQQHVSELMNVVGQIEHTKKVVANKLLIPTAAPKGNGLFGWGLISVLIGVVALIFPLFGAQNRIVYALSRGTDTSPIAIGFIFIVVGIILMLTSRSDS